MPMKIEEVDKILQKYEKEFDQNALFYSSLQLDSKNYDWVIIGSGQLPIGDGGIDKKIAEKVVRGWGDVALEYCDFREEGKNCRYAYCVHCHKESEIEKAITVVKQAKESLEQTLEYIADFLVSKSLMKSGGVL